jgi:hypothetical protein
MATVMRATREVSPTVNPRRGRPSRAESPLEIAEGHAYAVSHELSMAEQDLEILMRYIKQVMERVAAARQEGRAIAALADNR